MNSSGGRPLMASGNVAAWLEAAMYVRQLVWKRVQLVWGTAAEANFGAGTPFVCLYLFGWYFGEHWMGRIFGGIPLIFTWTIFVSISMTNSRNQIMQVWMNVLAMIMLSGVFFYTRIHGRTPKGFPVSRGFWVALVLETLMANTLTCVGHGLGTMIEEWYSLADCRLPTRFMTFLSPVGGWRYLRNLVLDRQAAVVQKSNMGNSMRTQILLRPGIERPGVISRYLLKIIDRSRDLRVTGLAAPELERVANKLESQGDGKEAGYIRFFTRGGQALNFFERLKVFHCGYAYVIRPTQDIALRFLCTGWVETNGSGDAFTVVKKFRDDVNSLSMKPMLRRELDNIASAPDRSDPLRRNWWLCGAIARVCDDGGAGQESSKYRRCYALMAAALCADRDALAVMRAMRHESRHYVEASEMSLTMATGCDQVLQQITGNVDISAERGVVMTSAPPDSIPSVQYSHAGVWQAEVHKEAFMMGKDAFNALWDVCNMQQRQDGSGGGRQEEGSRSSSATAGRTVTCDMKKSILHNSTEWTSKMINLVSPEAMLAFLELNSNTQVNLRAAAWRGWLMHFIWVALTIVIQFLFPDCLVYASTFSSAATTIHWNDLYAHIVFVAGYLWRSPIGRICQCFPVINDSGINSMARSAIIISMGVVNWLAPYMGNWQTLTGTICFLAIVCSSVMPGLICFALFGGDEEGDGTMGGTLVKYIGRSRGPGYSHRKSPVHHRPLGKYAVFESESGDFEVLPEHG